MFDFIFGLAIGVSIASILDKLLNALAYRKYTMQLIKQLKESKEDQGAD